MQFFSARFSYLGYLFFILLKSVGGVTNRFETRAINILVHGCSKFESIVALLSHELLEKSINFSWYSMRTRIGTIPRMYLLLHLMLKVWNGFYHKSK